MANVTLCCATSVFDVIRCAATSRSKCSQLISLYILRLLVRCASNSVRVVTLLLVVVQHSLQHCPQHPRRKLSCHLPSSNRSQFLSQCKKLNLVSVGLVGHPIRCLAVAKDFVFCGERGGIVSAWRRGKRVREYGSSDDAAVHALLVLGPLLLTLDEVGVVRVYTIDTGDLFVELADLDPAYFAATCMAHPATYLNKVCVPAPFALYTHTHTHTHIYPFYPCGVALCK